MGAQEPACRFDTRILSFLCGMAMMTAAGTEYMYSTYSEDLKDLMGYNQTETNFVGTCTNLGIYLGFYMGFLYDYAGARVVSLVSAVFFFVGWFGAYLSVTDTIPSAYWSLGLFMFIQGNGGSAAYAASIGNNLKKFPARVRGVVCGVLVSMFGLASAIFSPIYEHVFDANLPNFFLFFSVLLPIIGFSGVIFLSPHEHRDDQEEAKLVPEEDAAPGKSGKYGTSVIKEEVSSLRALTRLDFWLMFSVFMLGAGTGLVVINNVGGMVASFGDDNISSSTLVTFLSIFNALGRIIAGFTSDMTIKYHVASRPTVLTCGLVLMTVAQMYFVGVLTLDSAVWLYPGVAATGLAYGALMSLTPSITTELFGFVHFGGTYAMVRTAPAFSSFLMGMTAGRLNDRFTGEGEEDCFGWECWGWSLSLDTVISLVAVLLCALLSLRWYFWRRSYEMSRQEPAIDPEHSIPSL